MKKIHLLYAAFFLLLCISVASFFNLKKLKAADTNNTLQEAAYATEVSNFTDSLLLEVASQETTISQNTSFSSNFEGPKLSIAYLSHHGKIWDTEKFPEFSFTPQYINFDPDWESYGLPNLHIEVTQPEFITEIENNTRGSSQFKNLQNQLGFLSETHPVKTYAKTYKNKQGKIVKEQFHLYLTKFNITLGIKPMREAPVIKLTSEEKARKLYPKYWYQDQVFAGNRTVALNDLKRIKEDKNQRYAQLQCVFKIEPNNAVWYVGSVGSQTNAEVAIGEIITQQITTNFDTNSGYQQAHLIPSAPGLNVDLFSEATLNNRYEAASIVQRELTPADSTIFNKPVYFRIQSNNLGSWDKKGLFFGTEWDDQFTLSFVMPILVKGTFDVVLDTKFKPEYIPKKAYFNKVTFKDIIPDWGIKNFGKYLSYGFIIFILLVAIIFVPQVFTLINIIFKRIAQGIKKTPTK